MARAKGLAPLPDETSAPPPKEKARSAPTKVGSASEAPRGESEKAPYGERDNFYFLLIKGDRGKAIGSRSLLHSSSMLPRL